jgi:hypothetical protein
MIAASVKVFAVTPIRVAYGKCSPNLGTVRDN